MAPISLDGLIAATPTPFAQDGSLWLDAIGPLIDRLVDSGVSGLARARGLQREQDALAGYRIRLSGSDSKVCRNRRPAVSGHVLQDWQGVACFSAL
jgi:hypothetical protein